MADKFKINGIDYECEFKLSNSDGQEINFTKSAIRGMEISDNVFDPFTSGKIFIANPYDYIENEYMLRGDGRDKFKIMFKPADNDNTFKFEHEFIIIDDGNHVNPQVRSENTKTFILADSNILPFTEQIPYAVSYDGKVGKILQDIFIELLGEDKVDEKNWEEGDFELTYHPPLSFRYLDVVHYLMRIFYVKDDDIQVKAFISFDHKSGKYQMNKISEIFKNHKDHLSEAFALGDLTDKIFFDNPNNPPPEAETFAYQSQMKNFGYSTPFFGWNNDFYINSLVFGYDPILGIQKIKKLDIEDLRKKWQKTFVDVFKSKGGKPKPAIVFNKNTSKKYKHYRLPYQLEDSAKIVEAEIINNMIFYNLQCSFSNLGSSNRKSGMFLDIYNTLGEERELFSDRKTLGRWFITELRHVFFGDTYTNQFLCTKTYLGPRAKIDEQSE